MIRVEDIWDESKKIVGNCDDTKLFRWIGDALSMIVNKADFEGLKGYLDICTTGCSCGQSPCNSTSCGRRMIALPREVETIVAVNIGGKPALGFGELFNFHLNGPGDCHISCDWSWVDQGGWHSTYRDLATPAKLVVHLQNIADNDKKFIIYGYDQNNLRIRRQVGGQWLDGWQAPTIYGYAIPDTEAPTFSRITGIYKERSAGSMRLATPDDTTSVLGIYEPDEEIPQLRRIKINRSCNWVRIAYTKGVSTFHSRYDHIPLKSRIGFLLAMQARKHYSDRQWPEAHAAEADAARLEIEAQMKTESPTYFPMQVVDRNNLRDKTDFEIV